MSLGRGLWGWLAVLAALVVPVVALAAPPDNDDRGGAARLSIPGSVNGTLVEATLEEEGEPFGCRLPEGSVWYELQPQRDGPLSLRLLAFGDLDATIEVYRRVRSQLNPEVCDQTDETGEAGVRFRAEEGGTYLVRVTRLSGSAEDSFLLEAFEPSPAAAPPGPRLAPAGVTAVLDRLGNDDDAWSVRMRAGVSYRINEADRLNGCLSVTVFPPRTRSFFGARPARRMRCGGYTLYTPGPGEGGAHSIRVQAVPYLRGPQPYRLRVARAGSDDTLPGARLDRARRGAVDAREIDVVDLYRFDVVRRSDVTVGLRTSARLDLVVRREGGKRVACACGESGFAEFSGRLKRGRYYAAVRAQPNASGRYVLTKLARIITRTRASVDGGRRTSVRPGAAVQIGAHVGPDAEGPVTITVERRDPNFGWQFHRRFRIRAVGGLARVSFFPPTLGSYRVRAAFGGTRRYAPSESKLARVRVVEPIRR